MAFLSTPSHVMRRRAHTLPLAISTFRPSFRHTSGLYERAARLKVNSPQVDRVPLSAAMTEITSVNAGVGTSTSGSTDEAVAEAVRAASSELSGKPTVAIVLSTVDRQVEDVQKALQKHLPGVPVHGATTCVAALTNDGPAEKAISILLIQAPGGVSVGARASNGDVAAAARTAARDVVEKVDGDVAQLLLFATPGSEEAVISALAEEMPGVPVFGGSAADNTVVGNWRIFSADGIPITDGVSLLAVGTNVKFGAALVPPYEATSRAAVITRAEGRCIFELDGKPAATVLREWVGPSIDDQVKQGGNIIVPCASFPIGVEKSDGKYIGIHAAEILEHGAVGLFAEVANGETLTVLKGFEGAKDSASAARIGLERAYEKAIKDGGLTDPKAGILIYCGGLSIAVGDRLGESLQGMKSKAPLLGMTAFGEQGCLDGCNVHSNLAVGIALFG